MADFTVKTLAASIGISVEQMLQQLKDADIAIHSADQVITAQQKTKLLAHLQEKDKAAPKKIMLKKKSVTELKVESAPGRSKTVSVEVRKKRTIIKAPELTATSAKPTAGAEVPVSAGVEGAGQEVASTVETTATPPAKGAEAVKSLAGKIKPKEKAKEVKPKKAMTAKAIEEEKMRHRGGERDKDHGVHRLRSVQISYY